MKLQKMNVRSIFLSSSFIRYFSIEVSIQESGEGETTTTSKIIKSPRADVEKSPRTPKVDDSKSSNRNSTSTQKPIIKVSESAQSSASTLASRPPKNQNISKPVKAITREKPNREYSYSSANQLTSF